MRIKKKKVYPVLCVFCGLRSVATTLEYINHNFVLEQRKSVSPHSVVRGQIIPDDEMCSDGLDVAEIHKKDQERCTVQHLHWSHHAHRLKMDFCQRLSEKEVSIKQRIRFYLASQTTQSDPLLSKLSPI